MNNFIKKTLVKITVKFLNQSEVKQVYEASISIMQARERATLESNKGIMQARDILNGSRRTKIKVEQNRSRSRRVAVNNR